MGHVIVVASSAARARLGPGASVWSTVQWLLRGGYRGTGVAMNQLCGQEINLREQRGGGNVGSREPTKTGQQRTDKNRVATHLVVQLLDNASARVNGGVQGAVARARRPTFLGRTRHALDLSVPAAHRLLERRRLGTLPPDGILRILELALKVGDDVRELCRDGIERAHRWDRAPLRRLLAFVGSPATGGTSLRRREREVAWDARVDEGSHEAASELVQLGVLLGEGGGGVSGRAGGSGDGGTLPCAAGTCAGCREGTGDP